MTSIKDLDDIAWWLLINKQNPMWLHWYGEKHNCSVFESKESLEICVKQYLKR